MRYYENEVTTMKSGINFKNAEAKILGGCEIMEFINDYGDHVFTLDGDRLSGAALVNVIERYSFVNVIGTDYEPKGRYARGADLVGIWVLAH